MKTVNKPLKSLRACLIASISVILVACASGEVYEQHRILQNISPDTPVANVYILRPTLLKLKGASRRVFQVSFNGETIMKIGPGEYTLIKVQPGQVKVATHSLSKFTNKRNPIPVSRHRDYNFVEGMTYFIHLYRVNEEFRGVFFDPKPVSLREAKTFLHNLSPFGAAKNAPIDSLKNIEMPTAPSALPVVLPESLYPGEKYILTPNPFK